MRPDRDSCQVTMPQHTMPQPMGDELRRARAYWMGVPAEGAAVSLPAAPIELVACHTVPVLFVKK